MAMKFQTRPARANIPLFPDARCSIQHPSSATATPPLKTPMVLVGCVSATVYVKLKDQDGVGDLVSRHLKLELEVKKRVIQVKSLDSVKPDIFIYKNDIMSFDKDKLEQGTIRMETQFYAVTINLESGPEARLLLSWLSGRKVELPLCSACKSSDDSTKKSIMEPWPHKQTSGSPSCGNKENTYYNVSPGDRPGKTIDKENATPPHISVSENAKSNVLPNAHLRKQSQSTTPRSRPSNPLGVRTGHVSGTNALGSKCRQNINADCSHSNSSPTRSSVKSVPASGDPLYCTRLASERPKKMKLDGGSERRSTKLKHKNQNFETPVSFLDEETSDMEKILEQKMRDKLAKRIAEKHLQKKAEMMEKLKRRKEATTTSAPSIDLRNIRESQKEADLKKQTLKTGRTKATTMESEPTEQIYSPNQRSPYTPSRINACHGAYSEKENTPTRAHSRHTERSSDHQFRSFESSPTHILTPTRTNTSYRDTCSHTRTTPTHTPRSPTHTPRSPTNTPRSPTHTPRSSTNIPRSPTHTPGSPKNTPRSCKFETHLNADTEEYGMRTPSSSFHQQSHTSPQANNTDMFTQGHAYSHMRNARSRISDPIDLEEKPVNSSRSFDNQNDGEDAERTNINLASRLKRPVKSTDCTSKRTSTRTTATPNQSGQYPDQASTSCYDTYVGPEKRYTREDNRTNDNHSTEGDCKKPAESGMYDFHDRASVLQIVEDHAFQMKVSELKKALDTLGVAWTGCVEKIHLIHLLQESLRNPPKHPPTPKPQPKSSTENVRQTQAPPRTSQKPMYSANQAHSSAPETKPTQSTHTGYDNGPYHPHVFDVPACPKCFSTTYKRIVKKSGLCQSCHTQQRRDQKYTDPNGEDVRSAAAAAEVAAALEAERNRLNAEEQVREKMQRERMQRERERLQRERLERERQQRERTRQFRPPQPSVNTDMQVQQHEARWGKFESNYSKPIKFHHIPWPGQNVPGILRKDTIEIMKKKIRKATLRWHPDKFIARYGDSLCPNDRNKILTKVNDIMSLVSKSKQNLDTQKSDEVSPNCTQM
eukprot:CFRG0711T1